MAARRLVPLLLLLFALPLVQAATASDTPPPASVTIAGSLQSELGCPGDWQPDCAATHLSYDANDGVWQGTWSLPSGAYEYKAALNNAWDENYGAHAVRDGSNIALQADGSVRFYYDHETHWVTDNRNSVIATVPGSFQSELGCASDWDPGCLRSWLQDPDGDGIYSFSTKALPPGKLRGEGRDRRELGRELRRRRGAERREHRVQRHRGLDGHVPLRRDDARPDDLRHGERAVARQQHPVGRPRARQPRHALPRSGRRRHAGNEGARPLPHLPRRRHRRDGPHVARGRAALHDAARRLRRAVRPRVRLRLLAGRGRDAAPRDAVLPLHRPRRLEDRLLRGRQRRAGRRLGQAVRLLARLGLGADDLRLALRPAGRLDEERRRVPDLPRPLPERRHVERPGEGEPERAALEQRPSLRVPERQRGGARARPHPAAPVESPARGLLPQLLGRRLSEALAGRHGSRRPVRPRLLRRRPRGRDRAAAVPAGARRDRDLLQPDLRGGLEPPLRHARLPDDRPVPRLPEGLGPARADREAARDEGDPRRRLQPHVVGQPALRPVPQLPPDRRVREHERGDAVVVRLPRSGGQRTGGVRAVHRSRGRASTTRGRGSTRSRSSPRPTP